MTGCVFSIEEFSVYDGPGIRTTVFLKGCPLRCSWCHNPEGRKKDVQIVRSPNGCVKCGECEKYAEKCDGELVFTDKSIQSCPRSLLRYCGQMYEPFELCEKVLRNKKLLLEGGVTFSGGEPLYSSDFLCECLDLLEGQLHRAVQTCGFASEDLFKSVLERADYFLFDLKLCDNELHKKYTGVSNELIHKNFKILAESGKDFVVRIPVIPTVTDTAENIAGLCRIMKENGVKYAELMPYNKMAGSKYKMTGKVYSPDFDDRKEADFRTEIFEKHGIETYIM